MATQKVFDGLLVLQYRSGHKAAMELLVKRYHSKFCRHSWGYTHDMDASKDIVQDCWRIILKKLGSLKDPNAFSGWAMRIVTRKTLDYLNSRNRDRQHRAALKTEEGLFDKEEDKGAEIAQLRKAIRQLPQEQQTVLRLFYTQEYSLREISEILEISLGTVKSRLFHARERLKTKL
ncbi:MAG: sigma-70 family RNA polymerase sigma factor, partial [Bacteroidota bacterium]